MEWDMESLMPPQSISIREQQLNHLYQEIYALQTQGDFVEAVFHHNPTDELTQKAFKKMKLETAKLLALDAEFVKRKTIAKVRTLETWKRAKKEQNFSIVENNLTDIFNLTREEAQRFSSHEHLKKHFEGKSSYEILLDSYEPGFRASALKEILGELVSGTKKRLEQIIEEQHLVSNFHGNLPMEKAKQQELSRKVLSDLGFPFQQGRLDESTHPFCSGNPQDLRLTIRYVESDFLNGLYSTIHECGHGLYEASLPQEYLGHPCGTAASYGIHESQSRFYENFIARSLAFCEYLSRYTEYSSELIYHNLNQVEKSFIRVDADECTYNLHIALRMKIEEDLIEDKLKISELPEAWNSLFENYFGLKVPSVDKGCLQDIHWYQGSIGYFPCYSLGNLIAAELFEDFQSEFPQWEESVSKNIRTWIL
jgi:carboxypeptidase Taq